jgi:hypothetical protein
VSRFLAELKKGFGTVEGAVCYLDGEQVDSADRPVLTVAQVKAFKAAWDAATGHYPLLLYAPSWYWEQVPGHTQLAAMGFAGWWPSAYVSGSGSAATLSGRVSGSAWASWAGLRPVAVQYSASGQVPGVSGAVDLDQIRLSVADFKALATREDPFMALSDDDQANLIYTNGVGAAAKRAGIPALHVRLAQIEGDLADLKTSIAQLHATVTALQSPPST